MNSLAYFAVSLFAATAQTHLPVQIYSIGPFSYRQPQSTYKQNFSPTIKGDTLFVIITPSTEAVITDTQKNKWNLVKGSSSLWKTISRGGRETITITYPSARICYAVFAEFPGALVENGSANETAGKGAAAISNPMKTNDGDLILGYGWNTSSIFAGATALSPFTMEEFAVVFLEDTVQQVVKHNRFWRIFHRQPQRAYSGVMWTAPIEWVQGIAAFKKDR